MKSNKYLSKREIQLAEYEILKYLDAVCKKNNITYYLFAGTALGAARHKGFIPWDDDIDILMPRKEYDKLRGLKIQDERFEFVFPEEQDTPDYLFAKLFDKTIKLEAENGIDSNYLWIDIFQLDSLGNDPIAAHDKNAKLVKKFARVRRAIAGTNEGKTKVERIKFSIMNKLYSVYSQKRLAQKAINQYQKYNDLDSEYFCSTWSTNRGDILKKEWLKETIDIKFEDGRFKIFSGYKEYLPNRYGKNYMELPPKSMQVTHSFKAWKVNEK